MLRALALSFAMLAAIAGPCAAETNPSALAARSDVRNDVHKSTTNTQPTPNSDSAAGSSSGEDSAAENELLASANKSRALAGAPPLRMDESLREAARAHARRIVESERLDHQFSGELSLLERIAEAGSGNGALNRALNGTLKIDRAGENVAYAPDAPDVHEVLMHSPPHRENLLDRGFNVAGVAAVWSKGRLYVVQDFAHEVPSYSAEQSGKLVGRAIDEIRQQAGLAELVQLNPRDLDKSACSLAAENVSSAHLLATAYDNRKIITYTQSRPEILPQAALRMLRDPGVRQFAVGACYAHNAAHPNGTYWITILLY